MPTIITHAVVAAALVTAFPRRTVPRRITTLAVMCSMFPDVDVLGSAFGIRYEDFLGHRGFFHSLVFAGIMASLALLVALASVGPPRHPGLIWLYLFLASASHGVLDAFTNGGLGVALFSPFDKTRYFFPHTPIEVSPIGLDFFSEWGMETLLSEFRWVWLPSAVFVALALAMRRYLSRTSAGNTGAGLD